MQKLTGRLGKAAGGCIFSTHTESYVRILYIGPLMPMCSPQFHGLFWGLSITTTVPTDGPTDTRTYRQTIVYTFRLLWDFSFLLLFNSMKFWGCEFLTWNREEYEGLNVWIFVVVKTSWKIMKDNSKFSNIYKILIMCLLWLRQRYRRILKKSRLEAKFLTIFCCCKVFALLHILCK